VVGAAADARTLRVGLLGCGRIARLSHLPLLARLPGIELAAIAEPDPGNREACRSLAPGAKRFEHYQELLAERSLDAVIICLPPALHAEAAIAGFERGLHVYLEKPLATTLEDGRRIVRAWRDAGTTGWIGFNFRFHPLAVELRAALARGVVGAPLAARTTFGAGSRELPEWKRRRASGGGALLDLASHQFDLLPFLLGQQIVEVGCLVSSRCSEDDTALSQLRFSGGAVASVLTALSAVEEHRVEIVGPGGELTFDRYHASRLRFRPPRRDFGRSARLRDAGGLITGWPRALRDVLLPRRERSFALALAAFAEAARGRASPGPDLESGLRSLAVVLAAEQAARAGGSVRVTGTEAGS
jgi:predicted dehydrogenase